MITTTLTPGPSIELSRAELDAAQVVAGLGTEVRLHYANWPGIPSVPARALPASDEDGNVELYPPGRQPLKLFADPRELTVVPRPGLECQAPRDLAGLTPAELAARLAGHPRFRRDGGRLFRDLAGLYGGDVTRRAWTLACRAAGVGQGDPYGGPAGWHEDDEEEER